MAFCSIEKHFSKATKKFFANFIFPKRTFPFLNMYSHALKIGHCYLRRRFASTIFLKCFPHFFQNFFVLFGEWFFWWRKIERKSITVRSAFRERFSAHLAPLILLFSLCCGYCCRWLLLLLLEDLRAKWLPIFRPNLWLIFVFSFRRGWTKWRI